MKNDRNTNIEELKQLIRIFREERGWGRYHTPKDLAEAIVIEAAELLEHVLWKTTEETKKLSNDGDKKREVAEELADVIIYCLNFADITGIDVSASVRDKIKKNSQKYPVEKFKENN